MTKRRHHEPRTYDLAGAAEYLAVSRHTVQRLVDRGLLVPARGTRLVRFGAVELQRFACGVPRVTFEQGFAKAVVELESAA